MGDDAFDDLARFLAQPMSRRRVARLFGAAVAVAAVPALRPRSARARAISACDGPGTCSKGTACGTERTVAGKPSCVKGCCQNTGDAVHDRANAVCCTSSVPIPSAWCCATGHTCGSAPGEPNCVCSGAVNPATGECGPACIYAEPVLGTQKRWYDPKTQCCTRTGPQPKLAGFDAQACKQTLTPRPSFKPTANGCGTKEHSFPNTWPGPDAMLGNVKYKGKRANFGAVCNKHDICYGTCGADKETCDKAFCERLIKTCKGTWPKEGARQTGCISEAKNYCVGVNFLGDSAYWIAQGEACQCCP